MMAKQVSARKNFSQAEISHESKVVPFDQMKVSVRRTEPKEMRHFLQSIKTSVPLDQK